MSTDVFLSYARVDHRIAGTLARVLSESGLEVWWDRLLLPGEAFDRQIQRVLESTKIIVGLISPRSAHSPWVRWELSQAHENGLVVVPILADGAQPEDLPEPLSSVHALVLETGDAEAAIRETIAPIRRLVADIDVTPRRDENVSPELSREARRRLARAAAETARQAGEIKRTYSRVDLPRADSERAGPESAPPDARDFSMSGGWVDFLHRHDIAVAFTSLQTGQLFFLGRNPNGQALLHRQLFRKPMGLHLAEDTLLLSALSHIYRLENVLGPHETMDEVFTRCYLPRTGHYTGVLDAHDVGMTRAGDVVFVNTAYNCLASVSPRHSFKALWKPDFVSQLVAEDRCHLNGLAMREGRPAFVTAASRSDRIDGWRDECVDGGVVMDVERDRIACEGLSLPHSPRVHGDTVWVLNSGTGELGFLKPSDPNPGRFEPVTFLPGFVRGLAFHAGFAFVGMSRPRYEDFRGLPLDRRLRKTGTDAWCGVAVVDARSGELVEWFRIEGPAREVFDVAVLPGAFAPMSLGFVSHDAPGPITIQR